MSAIKSVKLKISKPFGKTLILSIVFMIIIGVLMELGARSKIAQRIAPVQAYGTNHVQFEVQYQILQEYVENHGAPECIIMGNSMAHRSMNPEIISERIIEKTGSNLECFNFSIVGANIAITATIAEILIERYHPKLLIVGTSFMDYTERRETRKDDRFLKNPWLLYLLGDESWEGWLLNNSYAFRLITFFSYATNQTSSLENIREDIKIAKLRITKTGFAVFRSVFEIWEPINEQITKRLLSDLGGYTQSKWNLDKLNEMAKYQETGVQVIFVEMPYHSTFIEFLDDSGYPLPERDLVRGFVDSSNKSIAKLAE
ncbi:MAG: hypothetical protein N2C13_02990, partial [Chloroflexota bacterium]